MVFDSGRLPAAAAASFALGDAGPALRLKQRDEPDIAVTRSVLWRRPGPYRISDAVTEPRIRRFCQMETAVFFRGAVAATRHLRLVNDPLAELAADHKPLQLSTAHELGLRVPKTLMTNDPKAAEAFYEQLGGTCIYKPFRAPSWRLAETRAFSPADLEYLHLLWHAPVIIQELIPKRYDVRVVVVDTEVIAARAETHIPEAELDWRLDLSADWHPCALPENLRDGLRALVARLGLEYGCIDLRYTPDGEYVFVEINPAGHFLFVRPEVARHILAAFVALLTKDPPHT